MAKKKWTFEQIKKIALANGAKVSAVRQWKCRKAVPYSWQVKLTIITGGLVEARHFVSMFEDKETTE